MTITGMITNSSDFFKEGLLGGVLAGAVLGTILLFALVVFLIYWVYTSLAWSTIGKKLKYKNNFLALIPFARTAMIFELGNFNWAWAFLWLLPIIGWIAIWVLGIIASWRIFELRNYPGWFALIIALSMVGKELGGLASIGYLIILGFVAWKDQKKKLFS